MSPNLGTTLSPRVPNVHTCRDMHAPRHTHTSTSVHTLTLAHTMKAEIPVYERTYHPRGTTPPWEGVTLGSCQPCAQHLTLLGLRSRCHCAGAPGANIGASPGTAPAPPLHRPGEHHFRAGGCTDTVLVRHGGERGPWRSSSAPPLCPRAQLQGLTCSAGWDGWSLAPGYNVLIQHPMPGSRASPSTRISLCSGEG